MFSHEKRYNGFEVKLIIAGTRHFQDYGKLCEVLNMIPTPSSIISGKARGADSLGELYAHDNNISVIECPANWDKYGKRAGYLRNEEMAKIADACIVFWDGESRGSKHMIEISKEHGLDTWVFMYNEDKLLHLKKSKLF